MGRGVKVCVHFPRRAARNTRKPLLGVPEEVTAGKEGSQPECVISRPSITRLHLEGRPQLRRDDEWCEGRCEQLPGLPGRRPDV